MKKMAWLQVGSLLIFLSAGASDVFAKDGVYEVVSPSGKSTIQAKPLAPSLKTLEGKTICELSNYKFAAEITFPAIEEIMAKQYRGIKFVRYPEFGCTHGPDEKTETEMIQALPEKLKKFHCDAVISGNGG
jgi:hypothetical protein